MKNLICYKRLWLLLVLCSLAGISMLPLEHRVSNETLTINQSKSQFNHKRKFIINHSDDTANEKTLHHTTDLIPAAAAADYQQRLHLPVAIKPRGFILPKNRPPEQKSSQITHQTAAQNYYSNFFPDLPSIEHVSPYYSLQDDPVISKFLSQHSKKFQPKHQTFPAPDDSILGSGDFGILRGGTFYSDEQQPQYIHEEGSDIYYGDASNTHAVTSTEGFIQKYTYPEEQFAQFRDFADLGTPADSDFSQYVVVYAANNASINEHQNTKPKNIFEQLQEIDKEKALEQKQFRKNQTSSSITKLKLVKTKQVEKKWVQKQSEKVVDDDPLIALS